MSNLRRVFSEICRGYSVAEWRGKPVYIKHLTHFDQVDIDVFHEKALAIAIKKGIFTRETKLKWLSEQGLWTTKNEREVTIQSDYVKTLGTTLKSLFAEVQIRAHKETTEREKDKLAKMIQVREDLVDLTAETVADRKVQFRYILHAFYAEETLTKRLFTERDMDRWDENDSYGLLDLYVNRVSDYGSSSIRKIAIADFFTSYFYLCADDIPSFFGKPICSLSVYQINLLSYGSYFKNVLSNHQVPDHVKDDPDKIEDYVNRKGAFDKVVEKTPDRGRVGIFASAGDLAAMGVRDDTSTVRAAANKQHKSGMEAAKDLGYTVN